MLVLDTENTMAGVDCPVSLKCGAEMDDENYNVDCTDIVVIEDGDFIDKIDIEGGFTGKICINLFVICEWISILSLLKLCFSK